jgi:hypothetical protein
MQGGKKGATIFGTAIVLDKPACHHEATNHRRDSDSETVCPCAHGGTGGLHRARGDVTDDRATSEHMLRQKQDCCGPRSFSGGHLLSDGDLHLAASVENDTDDNRCARRERVCI